MKSISVVNFSSKPGSVELQEIEYPLFGDDDVIMQVEAVSVCGSDLHQWHGTNSWGNRNITICMNLFTNFPKNFFNISSTL